MSDAQLSLDLGLQPAPPRARPAPPELPPPVLPGLEEELAGPGRLPGERGINLARPRLPFDYTAAMRGVMADVIATLPELAHVDLARVGVSVSQARQRSRHGTYASCVPLRFAGGAETHRVGESVYRLPVVREHGRELLYLVYFTLPRFHDEQEYEDKLATVIHELYHISPSFNGDIRRFPGKNFAHGVSRDHYHAAMRRLAARYLADGPRAKEHEFLRMPLADLIREHGGILYASIPRPRAYRV